MKPLSCKQTPGVASSIIKSDTFKIYCICRQPWLKEEGKKEEMAQCATCKEWYHREHMQIPNNVFRANFRSDYICNLCKKK